MERWSRKHLPTSISRSEQNDTETRTINAPSKPSTLPTTSAMPMIPYPCVDGEFRSWTAQYCHERYGQAEECRDESDGLVEESRRGPGTGRGRRRGRRRERGRRRRRESGERWTPTNTRERETRAIETPSARRSLPKKKTQTRRVHAPNELLGNASISSTSFSKRYGRRP